MTKDGADNLRDRCKEEQGELPMTREEAERRAAALTAAGSGHRWFARKVHGRLGGREGGAAAELGARPAQAGRSAGDAADARWPAAAYHRHFDGAGGAGGV